jgi:hypothetical protein
MALTSLHVLMLICGYVICIFVGVLAFLILRLIFRGDIDLSQLISEPNGDASLSRFQFLIFTFVIALSLFLVIVSASTPSFPYIPPTVLTLLGISGSSYLVSKGIQFSDPAGVGGGDSKIVISPVKETIRFGQTLQFRADTAGRPDAKVTWQVAVGPGTIDVNGLYTAPANAAAANLAANAQTAYATIQVSLQDDAASSDLAVITLKP